MQASLLPNVSPANALCAMPSIKQHISSDFNSLNAVSQPESQAAQWVSAGEGVGGGFFEAVYFRNDLALFMLERTKSHWVLFCARLRYPSHLIVGGAVRIRGGKSSMGFECIRAVWKQLTFVFLFTATYPCRGPLRCLYFIGSTPPSGSEFLIFLAIEKATLSSLWEGSAATPEIH